MIQDAYKRGESLFSKMAVKYRINFDDNVFEHHENEDEIYLDEVEVFINNLHNGIVENDYALISDCLSKFIVSYANSKNELGRPFSSDSINYLANSPFIEDLIFCFKSITAVEIHRYALHILNKLLYEDKFFLDYFLSENLLHVIDSFVKEFESRDLIILSFMALKLLSENSKSHPYFVSPNFLKRYFTLVKYYHENKDITVILNLAKILVRIIGILQENKNKIEFYKLAMKKIYKNLNLFYDYPYLEMLKTQNPNDLYYIQKCALKGFLYLVSENQFLRKTFPELIKKAKLETMPQTIRIVFLNLLCYTFDRNFEDDKRKLSPQIEKMPWNEFTQLINSELTEEVLSVLNLVYSLFEYNDDSIEYAYKAGMHLKLIEKLSNSNFEVKLKIFTILNSYISHSRHDWLTEAFVNTDFIEILGTFYKLDSDEIRYSVVQLLYLIRNQGYRDPFLKASIDQFFFQNNNENNDLL